MHGLCTQSTYQSWAGHPTIEHGLAWWFGSRPATPRSVANTEREQAAALGLASAFQKSLAFGVGWGAALQRSSVLQASGRGANIYRKLFSYPLDLLPFSRIFAVLFQNTGRILLKQRNLNFLSMSGIIGKKVGMTSVFDAEGRSIGCTVILAGPCVVTQVKTVDSDGYEAVQLAFDEKKEKNTAKPQLGHFKKAGTTPKRKLVEFRHFENVPAYGSVVDTSLFSEGDFVDAIGTSKGKGFQGVVKRHGFAGVGGQTHGQHNRARHPGSIGACSFPSRVFKGLRMAGRMGGDRVKVQNLKVMKVMPENNLIVVSGSVPGAINSYVLLEK